MKRPREGGTEEFPIIQKTNKMAISLINQYFKYKCTNLISSEKTKWLNGLKKKQKKTQLYAAYKRHTSGSCSVEGFPNQRQDGGVETLELTCTHKNTKITTNC